MGFMSKIYNIPLQKNFLNEIAVFINNIKSSEIDLAEYTVFLPNRRSCRELKNIILKKYDGKIVGLPKIKAISDEFSFDDNNMALFVVDLLKKNLKNNDISINTFFELAKSVVSLIKDLILGDVELEKLKNIVPQHFMEYWSHTICILHECMEHREIKKIIETVKIQFSFFLNSIEKNHEKIIVAGIGDTNNYTRKFLKSVYASENGIIFFTGNEKEHSQNRFINQKIINFLGKNFDSADVDECAKKHIIFSQFPNVSEETFAISFAVREAVFEKKSVLIVTSDTILSTKIKAELLRWNIIADDSFGKKFSETQIGITVSSIIDAIYSDFRTADTLNILKFDQNYNNFILDIEMFFKKQQRVPLNFFDACSFWYKKSTYNIDSSREFQDFQKKILDISEYTQEFCNSIKKNDSKKFIDWFQFCVGLVELINHESAEGFKTIASQFTKHSDLLGEITFEEFVVFLKNQILSSSVRVSKGYTDGVVILGMIESQLLDADLVIIAGANEKSMSSSEKNDFWMSKSMLNVLNIQTIDAKNKFIQCIFERLIDKSKVLITRSKTVSGVQQQIYSPLEKIIKENNCIKNGSQYVYNLEESIEHIHRYFRYRQIEFVPPNPRLCYRPNKFSATDIESLANNPYAFYAKKVLLLKKINSINDRKNLKGIFVHDVLNTFVKENHSDFTINMLEDTAKNVLKNKWLELNDFGIWFFKLKNIFSFFIKNINKDTILFSEKRGECTINTLSNYVFNIFCIADRIDLLEDDTLSIVDYKTGSIPSKKQVERGYKPQLPVEAIIAKNNGFKTDKINVSSLLFWSLNGDEEGGKIFPVTKKVEDTEKLIEKTLSELCALIDQYNVIGVPYNINLNYEYDKEYFHLARVKEWHDA